MMRKFKIDLWAFRDNLSWVQVGKSYIVKLFDVVKVTDFLHS